MGSWGSYWEAASSCPPGDLHPASTRLRDLASGRRRSHLRRLPGTTLPARCRQGPRRPQLRRARALTRYSSCQLYRMLRVAAAGRPTHSSTHTESPSLPTVDPAAPSCGATEPNPVDFQMHRGPSGRYPPGPPKTLTAHTQIATVWLEASSDRPPQADQLLSPQSCRTSMLFGCMPLHAEHPVPSLTLVLSRQTDIILSSGVCALTGTDRRAACNQLGSNPRSRSPFLTPPLGSGAHCWALPYYSESFCWSHPPDHPEGLLQSPPQPGRPCAGYWPVDRSCNPLLSLAPAAPLRARTRSRRRVQGEGGARRSRL